ncbi:MAG: DUF1566 domain-containing protein [Lysobacterales bacterium]
MKPVPNLASAWLIWVLSSSAAQAALCVNENTAIPASTPTSDFTLHPDGTATHHKTGLMWDRCVYGQSNFGPSGEECSQTAGPWAWFDFLVFTRNVMNPAGYKGYHDWRLPNIKELMSIVEYRCWNPAFNTEVFPGMVQGDLTLLLSNTPIINGTTGGGVTYGVYVPNGFREFETTGVYFMHLVRGGTPTAQFDEQFPSWILSVKKAGSGSGTVTDTEGSCLALEENAGECLVAPGSNVTLHATPGPGAAFVGWSASEGSVPAGCNNTTGDCAISAMAASGRVTANFQSLDPNIFANGFEVGL